MAEATEPQETTSSDNTHWGIAYLREDLQDLRLQMREDGKELRLQIVETNQRMEEFNESIRQQMREDGKELRDQIVETNKRIDEMNKLIGSRFTWLITAMVALTGILIAVIKL